MKQLLLLFLTSVTIVSYSQEQKKTVSLGTGYKLFGSGDVGAFFLGGNYNKEVGRFFAFGIEGSVGHGVNNLIPRGYDFEAEGLDPSDYSERVTNIKVSPYLQLTPLNTEKVDLFLQLGPQFGLYNQNNLFVGYTIVFPQNGESYYRDITLRDRGDVNRGLYLAYDLGIGSNIDFNKFRLSPKANIGYDLNGNSIGSVGFEIGKRFH